MSDTASTPVVFLAFANDRVEGVRYLRNLPEEAHCLYDVLDQAAQRGLCEVLLHQNVTLDLILDVFQDVRYRNRIALFHYAGHANSYQLLFENRAGQPAPVDAGGLAAFLSQQRGLQVVFLNGCSTQLQAQGLLEAGVAAVIATAQAIADDAATAFASRFYQALAGGAPIQTAYHEAAAALQSQHGSMLRHLYAGEQDAHAAQLAADRLPWSLYLRPGAETVAQWDLPSAVDDPLFGLPDLPQLDLPPSPYRYLDWYRQQDAELFFGRGRTIRDLYTRLTSSDSAPLLLFYGQSGVGKSSLLAAGLLPRLAPTHTVAYLRRNQALGLLGTLTTPPSPLLAQQPGLGWREAEQQAGQPLVVILDQLEEVFTRPNQELPDELGQLLAALQGVFGDPAQRPQGKLILSFRKEWLAELEKRLAEARLPRAKIFLERLDRAGIIEVVVGPTRIERLKRHYGLRVEEGLADEIADDLLADPDSPVATMLQILLAKLWEQATQRSPSQPHFDAALYQAQRRHGIALDAFLDEQLHLLHQTHATAVESGLALDLLACHTTAKGTAEQRRGEELAEAYPHHPDLPVLVQRNKDLYLLSDAGGEGSTQGVTRLAHDTLAPLVRARFDESDLPGQRAWRILENRAVEWQDGQEGAPLDEADLALVEAGQAGMRAWSKDEVRLIEASRQARAARDQERARRRRWSQFAVAVIALLAVVGLGLALWANVEADNARQAQATANAESTRANQEAERAEAEATNANVARLAEATAAARAQAESTRAVAAQATAEAEAVRANAEAQRAEAEARLAQSRALAAAAQVQAETNPMRGWLLAIEAGRAAETDQAFAEIERQAPFIPRPLLALDHEDSVNGAQWNADASRILTWSSDTTARVWDAESGTLLHTLTHESSVSGAQWNADETRILTWSSDGTARVWDADSGTLLRTLTHEHDVYGAQWNADESQIMLWTYGGEARRYYTHIEDVIRTACLRATRNLTQEELDLYFPGEQDAHRQTCPHLPPHPSVASAPSR